MRIIGGDFAGYTIILQPKGLLLKSVSKTVNISKSEIASCQVLDQNSHYRGTRMAAKSYVFSKLGLGGLWGGLSTKAKNIYVVGIQLVDGRSILVEAYDSDYKKLLQHIY